MASGAARWLALAPLRSGALRSAPSVRHGGDGAAVRGGSGPSLVPSRSVIVTRSGAILPKPVKVSVCLKAGRRGHGESLWGVPGSALTDRGDGQPCGRLGLVGGARTLLEWVAPFDRWEKEGGLGQGAGPKAETGGFWRRVWILFRAAGLGVLGFVH